jgi:exopolyphosphatase/guanosine-5'-triphosphate,3'-diphosphate pyrophosphatase
MKKYPLRTIHNYVALESDFTHTYNLLKGLDLDRTKRLKGISSGRADILPSAFAAINAFKKYVNIGDMVISASGLRTGQIFNYALPSTIDKPISDVLTFSLLTLVEKYGCDLKHTENVVNLSIQLFKQLRVLHKFPRQYLRILKVASYLHESGKSIQYYNYQKHSGYIILNSTLNGISHKDMVLASFVASNTAIEDINQADWARYSCFVNDEDAEAVKKMGVILRLAEALDRSGSGSVTNINCDILGDSVIMKTETVGDATLEKSSAIDISADFRRVFKKNLEIL